MKEDIDLEELYKTRREAKEKGEKYYFTGVPCKRGHIAVRKVHGGCVPCAKNRYEENKEDVKKQYRIKYRENREEILARNRRWRENNKERKREGDRKYREENKDRLKEYFKKYYLDNREYILTYTKEWIKDNPDKHKEYCKTWESRNRDKCSAKAARRRAKKLERTLEFTDTTLEAENKELIEEYYTLRDKMTELHGVDYHVDHIVPLQGEKVSGFHVWYNLQVMTGSENDSKGNSFTPYIENFITGQITYLEEDDD